MGVKLGSITLREEHRLRMLANRVLKRITVPKRDEIIRQWRLGTYEELNDMYCSPNTVRVIKLR
jgi:hypothetical protein